MARPPRIFYSIVETVYRPLDAAGRTAMTKNLIRAHRRASAALHAANRGAQVSSNIVWRRDWRTTRDDPFLQGVKDKLDYVGVDCYYPFYKDTDLAYLLTGAAWKAQLAPFGMFTALRSLHRAFPKLPIMITENGMPLEDGKQRADGYRRGQNLRDNVYWLQRARSAGVPVIGYLYWSLTDNYEFGNYTSRFGLYSVDVLGDRTLRRVPTDAVPVYRSVTRNRGVGAGYDLVWSPEAADCAIVTPADRRVCLAAAR